MLARGKCEHRMHLSVSCQLSGLSHTLFTADEYYTERARVALGGFVGISKAGFFPISVCVVQVPIFNLQLCWENISILDLECALPEGSKRVSGKEIKLVSLGFFPARALWQ